jgi:uncharacterized damage-inducible protein DinB
VDVLANEVLDEFGRLHDRMRAVVRDLDEAALSRTPADGENSIAVLVTHTLGSELGWLHRAAGSPFQRDRDAEFRAKASSESLRASIDATEQQVTGLIEATDTAGLATMRKMGDGSDATAGFCLTHALAHTAEHVGHAELTRNLLGYRAK